MVDPVAGTIAPTFEECEYWLDDLLLIMYVMLIIIRLLHTSKGSELSTSSGRSRPQQVCIQMLVGRYPAGSAETASPRKVSAGL